MYPSFSYFDGLALKVFRVFLLEGLTTMAFALVVWFILPDYPKSQRSSKWLSKREQEFLEARLTDNAPKTYDATFSAAETVDAIKDVRTWTFMLAQVCCPLKPQ